MLQYPHIVYTITFPLFEQVVDSFMQYDVSGYAGSPMTELDIVSYPGSIINSGAWNLPCLHIFINFRIKKDFSVMNEAGPFAFNVHESPSTITNCLNIKQEKLFIVIEILHVFNWSFNFYMGAICTPKYL